IERAIILAIILSPKSLNSIEHETWSVNDLKRGSSDAQSEAHTRCGIFVTILPQGAIWRSNMLPCS
ncbi:MAG: hypothetical protein V2I43_08575, partial [Parvularcula sp.]|nr:hypothetical protein [Parvularcula sp.]